MTALTLTQDLACKARLAGLLCLAIAADLVTALKDAGLALSAMVFRLTRTVLIVASLMALLTAWLLLPRADALTDAPTLAPLEASPSV